MMSTVNNQASHNKQALVLGAGVTGVAAVRFLLHQGYSVQVADNRNRPPGRAELEQLLPEESLNFGVSLERASLTGVDCLLVSPGLPRSLSLLKQARNLGIKVVSDIEIFLQHANAPIIAVTGTNGKSTLVMMIQHLLRAAGKRVASGGNLGPAALDLLADPAPDYYLLELSSFQLEWLRKPALAVAVITNITPDHLDRYDTFADYRAAKANILRGADQVVLNLDDISSRKLAMTLPVTTRIDWFGHEQSSTAKTLVPLQSIEKLEHLPGDHNRMNAQAAMTVLTRLQLADQLPPAPWASFEGLPHRLQKVVTINQVSWINDSKATNVGATVAAVEGLALVGKGKLVLIAGGEGKGQDFAPLQPLANSLRALVIIGRDGDRIGKRFDKLIPVSRGTTMQDAVTQAATAALPGDSVLLSPACASQDQYRDYRHRGEQFVKEVLALAKEVEE